jgi:hypothetical protein
MSVQETKSIIGALRLRLQPLNVKELAWIFRVTEDTALKWVREGRFSCISSRKNCKN